ncbi:MAG: hypothetical protein KC931_00130 [Candidatus Omnitrophica bacterium]|nr:hypothetical protein [Candidatus Omnitrophota bacterium]MCA9424064.1 hypothetical protein [Candidatus Omnitrophota bacterium]MCA9445489.1 hypothetical protein [Candidatus Omnitrophota bacterium]MCB9770517.1 hypothetical protein [Candidatus Omnitrophota bacterium]MCB9782022.1 hypothetical protein [Candidatus Omnitrophota bacterium]
MKFLEMNKGRLARLSIAFLVAALSVLVMQPQAMAQSQAVQIDLDRNADGIQSALEVTPSGGAAAIQGAVVVTGAISDTVGQYAIEVQASNDGGGDAVDCTMTTFADGEITSNLGSELCTANAFRKSRLFVSPEVQIGDDGVLTVFTFDVSLMIADGESVAFSFTSTATNPQFGITVNSQARTFGGTSSSMIETVGATVSTAGGGGTPTNTPTTPPATFTPAPDCEDTGYYILDSLGGRHDVGTNVVQITGPLYYGRDVARDMENVTMDPTGGPVADLAVLDSYGAVQFVENPGNAPAQMFYFPEGSDPACGYAVDVELTADSQGFWVLTEAGGIFRAGTAFSGGDPQLGNDAADLCATLNIPFGGGIPRDPNVGDDDVSPRGMISAVGFVVVEGSDAANPDGFVVLDSQGGHYIFDGAGNTLDDGVTNSILSGSTVYPFFPGLDIARDIELHPAKTNTAGLVIYDGWGGIHPVPVGFDLVNDPPLTQVAFLRNMEPAQTTTVGLPYIVAGFDNTGSTSGTVLDVDSIFRDIEFCATTSGDGVYVMDAYGAVFAFGNTRADANSVAPRFTGGPYFFPDKFARDLEPQTEVEPETTFAVDAN